MDRQYIEDHNVIERYLKNQLSVDELEAFEDAFILDPDLLEEIDSAEALIDELPQIDTLPTTGVEGGKKNSNIVPITTESQESKLRWLPLSLAANLLMAVGLGFLLLQTGSPRDIPNIPLSAVNIPGVNFEYLRSASVDNAPVVRRNNSWVSLRVSGALYEGMPGELQILDANGDVVLNESEIRADPFNQWIDWMVHDSQLPPGNYELVVRSMEEGQVFTVQVPFLVCDQGSKENACP